jgi:integrase/recombinase XerD
MAHVCKPLAKVTLGDMQGYADTNGHKAPQTQARSLAAIKSLFTFANRIGYLPLNVGAVVEMPKSKDTLAERILPEVDVMRLLALETNRRNYCILHLLYVGKLRVSELCGLKWRGLQPRNGGGQVSIFGKGKKTRTILVNGETWKELTGLRAQNGNPDEWVFKSRKGGGRLSACQVDRIVKKAAEHAGLECWREVSPHWLRHSGASHYLDKGGHVHVLRNDLGHSNIATTSRYVHVRPTESSALMLTVPAFSG